MNAGNQQKKALQGIARGIHVRDCITELGDIVEELIGGLMKSHASFAAALAAMGVVVPRLAGPAGDASDASLDVLGDTLYELKIKKSFWQVNYTMANSDKYIVSKNVFST